ncbi:MAG: nitroreductase family protein [Synergistales bacterium]|nr:nitroreductase family protein [Synergistales bacterium]
MLELLRNRRSIRRFRESPVEPEKVEALQEAMLRSPSAKNIKPWEFVIVESRGLLKELADCKPQGGRFLAEAPLGVVVIADERESDVWVEDCSIASVIIQLEAEALGLSSCWIQIRNRPGTSHAKAEDVAREILGIPAHYRVASIIALGYGNEEKPGHPREELPLHKVHRNRYSPS